MTHCDNSLLPAAHAIIAPVKLPRVREENMTLSLEEVEHIAELAKLALTDEEKSRFREQLSSILDYANSLQALDTSDIPPTATVLPLDTVLRPDVPRESLNREELLANTSRKEDGMFCVEAILD